MQFPTTISSLFILLSIANAIPTVEKRQGKSPLKNQSILSLIVPNELQSSGGAIYATQTYYSGGGCTGTADGEATFGGVNLCQPIRSVLGSVVSVTADSVTDSPAGCVGKSSPSVSSPISYIGRMGEVGLVCR